MAAERFEVPHEALNRKCDPDGLGFETTDEVTALKGMIGQ